MIDPNVVFTKEFIESESFKKWHDAFINYVKTVTAYLKDKGKTEDIQDEYFKQMDQKKVILLMLSVLFESRLRSEGIIKDK